MSKQVEEKTVNVGVSTHGNGSKNGKTEISAEKEEIQEAENLAGVETTQGYL